MSTAAELIQALQRRLRLTQYRSRPGEFPPGWQAWFDGMRERPGAVSGAPVEEVVAVLLQRPLAIPPQAALALNRWQAFSALWRQEWEPPAREERWLRVLAAMVSGLVHVVLAVLFLWLAIVHLALMSAPPRGEETVIQVEYLGTGAAEQVGGGPVPEPEPEEVPEPVATVPQPPTPPSDSSAATPSAPRLPPLPDVAEPQVPELRMEQPQFAQREIPDPQPAAEQPLAVSKPVPDRGSFVLPPPRMEVPDAAVDIPALQLPAPQLQVAEEAEPLPEPLTGIVPASPQIEVPSIRSEAPEVTVREIPTPLPPVELPRAPAPVVVVPELEPEVMPIPAPTLPTPPAPEPEVAVEEPAAEERAVEEPAVEEPAIAETPATAPEREPAPPASTEPSTPDPEPIVGAGPKPTPAPGGWPAPRVDDSWDRAEQDRPGAQAGQPPGLYDSDGSVNLAETPGSASPGFPPGTVTQEIANLDRAGTWLRRPPTDDYEPTVFDRYWRPNETLIAEWVRKSITTVRIPIPGTSKSIVCTTVLIAVGGTCDIFDPNLNDQPATARPPPDIPFKPELQEGNGSVPPDT